MRPTATARRLGPLLAGALVLPLLTVPAGSAAAPAPGTAYVRVNQVGYASAASKRAYLMSTGVETGATFAVKSGAVTVFTESVGADRGAWSNTYKHVYVLDFG